MTDKQLLLFPASAKFSEEQLQEMRDAGFVPVRVKDVNAVRIVSPAVMAPIEGSKMLLSALKAIRHDDDRVCYQRFIDGLIADLASNLS